MLDVPTDILTADFLMGIYLSDNETIRGFTEEALEREVVFEGETVKMWQAAILYSGDTIRDISLNEERIAFFRTQRTAVEDDRWSSNRPVKAAPGSDRENRKGSSSAWTGIDTHDFVLIYFFLIHGFFVLFVILFPEFQRSHVRMLPDELPKGRGAGEM